MTLDETPARAPDLARGAEVYRASCASCHGDLGRGDGPLAAGLDPAPSNLADWAALRDQSPLDFYRRVTIGVVGTAMPAFEERLPAGGPLGRRTLRFDPPASARLRRGSAGLRDFAATGKMSDAELLDSLGAAGDGSGGGLSRLAAVRSHQSRGPPPQTEVVLARVRAEVDSAYAMARAGDPGAGTTGPQRLHDLRAGRARAAGQGARASPPRLEGDFAALRAAAARGAGPELDDARARLTEGLDRAGRVLGEGLSPPTSSFSPS